MESTHGDVVVVHHRDDGAWPINWSGVWAGALAALAAAAVFGLAASALGANQFTPGYRIVNWNTFGLGALIFAIAGAFFSFVLGGWVAAKISGYRREEPTMLHGALAWLVAVPLLMAL